MKRMVWLFEFVGGEKNEGEGGGGSDGWLKEREVGG